MKNKSFLMFPDFQRESTVWDLGKKQRLIDSILRGFDISAIYLFKNDDGTWDCIDGRQRINCIYSYLGQNDTLVQNDIDNVHNAFPLKMENEIFNDGEKYSSINGKRYSSLSREWKDIIDNYELNIVEIELVSCNI
jgi:hypothetical protein